MTDSEQALLLAMARAMIHLLDGNGRDVDAHYAQAIQRLAEAIKARRSPAAEPSRPAPPRICPAGQDAIICDAALARSLSRSLDEAVSTLGAA